MEGEQKNENETSKKAKKEAEMENNEVEDLIDEDAMESFDEEFRFEAPTVASCLPSVTIPDSSEESESEISSTPSFRRDYDKREKAMQMKWKTVTGKRPLNMPIVVPYETDEAKADETNYFLGNRRPVAIDKERQERWEKLKAAKKLDRTYNDEGRILQTVRFSSFFFGLRCLRFSPDANTLATAFGNGIVQIRKPDTGDVSAKLQTVESVYKLEVTALRFHPKNYKKLYVGGASGTIQVFQTSTSKCIGYTKQKKNEIYNLDLSRDGSLLVSVGKDSNIYLYDSETLRKKPTSYEETTANTEMSYHHTRIYGLRCHPTNPTLYVTGGWDYTVKVWDTRTCGAVLVIRGPRICGDSIDVRGNEILTGSWQASNSLKTWDLSSGRLIRDISVMNRSSPIDGEFIYVTKFFHRSKDRDLILAGGHGLEEMLVINQKNNMAIASFPALKPVTAMDFYGNIIAYGGMESMLRIGFLNQPQIYSEEFLE